MADEGQLEHGQEAEGELVVPGGDGAAALEPPDGALHDVAPLVGVGIDGQSRPAHTVRQNLAL